MTLTYLQGIRALSDPDLITERANQVSQQGIDPEAEAHVADCDIETDRRVTYIRFVNEPPQVVREIGD